MRAEASIGVRGYRGSINRKPWAWLSFFLVLWALAVAGCGGDDAATDVPPADAALDGHLDAAKDAAAKDTGTTLDTGIVGLDVAPETAPPADVTSEPAPPQEAGSDVTVGSDAKDATAPDVAADTGTVADAGPDAKADAGSDVTTVDAVSDVTTVDTGSEAAAVVTLTSIAITPVNPSIAKGTPQQFAATGTYSDTTTQDLTASVTWSSTTTATATIDGTGLATGVAPGQTTIKATLGSTFGSATLTVTAAILTSITVTQTNPTIADGTTIQFVATGTFSDTSTQDITASTTWSSGTTSVATIDNAANKGLATAQAPGQSTITATSGAINGFTKLTVTAGALVSITVTPTNPSIAIDTAQQFKATGNYTDGSTQDLTASAIFASSNQAIATLSGVTPGLASALGAGQTTISAAVGAITGSTLLTVTNAALVSIAVTPTNPSVASGFNQQFFATGTFSDSSTQDITGTVTWESSNTTAATISNSGGSRGLANGLAVGDTTIKATRGLVSGSTTFHVTAAILQSITVSPSAQSIANGTTLQLTATGVFSDSSTQNLTASVTWGSSSSAVASISNAGGSEGLATGQASGTTTISATSGGITGSTTLTVTPATLVTISVTPAAPSVAKGTSLRFAATGIYTDSTTQDLTAAVTWDSSLITVATISNGVGSEGLTAAVGTGTTIIRATQGAVSGQTTLTVTAATLVSIAINPTNPTIAKGTAQQFTATGTYSDNSTQDLTTTATWGSSLAGVASISNSSGTEGNATTLTAGSTAITATIGSISGSTVLTVTPATLVSIAVTPTNPSIAKGTALQLTATGTYTDATTQNLTATVAWSSSNGAVANVSNGAGSQGLATALLAGQSSITATSGAIAGSTTLTVTAAILQNVSITPVNPSIAKGTTTQFAATGTYSDGTTQDVTGSATWASSQPSVAIVDNTSGNKGFATGTGVGSSIVTATVGAVSGTTNLGVTAATLTSIAVTPVTPSIANGTTAQFTAIGTYSDATTQDLTLQVAWTSEHLNVAAISNAPASKGFATAVGTGTSTISATRTGVTGSTVLTVTTATLDSITIAPLGASIAKGTSQLYAATGNYSDGTTQNLTTQVTWVSSAVGTAAISNSAGTEGLATSVAAGTTTISATLGVVTTSTSLTVTNATLQSITVLPANKVVTNAQSIQYSASGHYSDATDQTLTTQVSWSSTNVAVAIISNSPGSLGLATPVGGGTTSIHATLSGVTGATNLTYTP